MYLPVLTEVIVLFKFPLQQYLSLYETRRNQVRPRKQSQDQRARTQHADVKEVNFRIITLYKSNKGFKQTLVKFWYEKTISGIGSDKTTTIYMKNSLLQCKIPMRQRTVVSQLTFPLITR